MDYRWHEERLDSKRDVRVFLHPTATIGDVRRQTATDGVDVSGLMTEGSHSAFECQVTLKWRTELFGTQNQPRPGWILEVQLQQDGLFSPLWMGIVDNLSSYTIARGERSMQLTARTRDSLDIFRTVKRVTPLFPQMTDVGYMIERIAMAAGLEKEEITLPYTPISTAHSNTQMSDMSAWDMLTQLFTAVGWSPWIDGIGRLRGANRTVAGEEPSQVLLPERVKKVQAQRQRTPISRVRVKWLDPVMKKSLKQGQLLKVVPITFGWYLPFWKKTVYFSDDETLRADKTDFAWGKDKSKSANVFFGKGFVKEEWKQTGENKGVIHLTNFAWAPLLVGIWATWFTEAEINKKFLAAHMHEVVTVGTPVSGGYALPSELLKPLFASKNNWYQWFVLGVMMMITNAEYHIYGMPYDWIHARNITEAFDSSAPSWIDNATDVESDFLMHEAHAQAVAVRELIFQAWQANKWSVELVDDPRIEFGDILEFPDGSRMYVEDYSRKLSRDSEAILSVSGFLLGNTGPIGQVIGGANPVTSPDGELPGEPGVPGPTPPPTTGGGACPERSKAVPLYDGSGIVNDYARAHPDQLANSCQDKGGSWAFMEGCVAALQAADSRFGFNGKRGNAGDLSHDAISYYCGTGSPTHGSKDVYVIDIIGGHCGGDPGPAWINQSNDDQACGAWVASR